MSHRPRSRRRVAQAALLVLAAIVGLLVAPTAAGAGSAPTTPPPSPEVPPTAAPDAGRADAQVEPWIVGGRPADPGAWPSQVALVHASNPDSYNAQFCGGTLIARSWVLTAAHCVRGPVRRPTVGSVAVLVGTQDLASGGKRMRAVEFRIHPGYDYEHDDIALIRLDKPAPAHIAVQPLTAEGVSPPAGTPVTATGWGDTDSGVGQSYPADLHEVELQVTSPAVCRQGYPEYYQQATMVCATAPGRDACQGDSGGPLVENRAGSWIQVGITVYGEGCAQPGYPGVYTKVAAYSSWIKQQIRYGPHPDAASFVRRMHLDAYDREPTPRELAAAVAALDAGRTPGVYARGVLDQPTYQARTGGVIRLYQAIFLRRPDTAGLAYWWSEVNGGMSLKRVAELMVGAPEFDVEYDQLDDPGFVDLVYSNVLGRTPRSDERAYWVAELASGRRSRGQVMVGFSESPEYKAATQPGTRVIGDFFALLRRVPTEDDITYWSGPSGLSLVTAVVRGWEYARRF